MSPPPSARFYPKLRKFSARARSRPNLVVPSPLRNSGTQPLGTLRGSEEIQRDSPSKASSPVTSSQDKHVPAISVPEPQSQSEHACAYCGAAAIAEDADMLVCQSCGHVVDGGPRTREGTNVTRVEPRRQTRGDTWRMGYSHLAETHPSESPCRMEILSEIRRLSNHFGLTYAEQQQAQQLMRTLQAGGNYRVGPSQDSTVTACIIVYTCCRLNSKPVTLMDVADLLRVSVFRVGRIYKRIVRLLGVQVPETDGRAVLRRAWGQLHALAEAGEMMQLLKQAEVLLDLVIANLLLAGRNFAPVIAAVVLLVLEAGGISSPAAKETVICTLHVAQSTLNLRLIEVRKLILTLCNTHLPWGGGLTHRDVLDGVGHLTSFVMTLRNARENEDKEVSVQKSRTLPPVTSSLSLPLSLPVSSFGCDRSKRTDRACTEEDDDDNDDDEQMHEVNSGQLHVDNAVKLNEREKENHGPSSTVICRNSDAVPQMKEGDTNTDIMDVFTMVLPPKRLLRSEKRRLERAEKLSKARKRLLCIALNRGNDDDDGTPVDKEVKEICKLLAQGASEADILAGYMHVPLSEEVRAEDVELTESEVKQIFRTPAEVERMALANPPCLIDPPPPAMKKPVKRKKEQKVNPNWNESAMKEGDEPTSDAHDSYDINNSNNNNNNLNNNIISLEGEDQAGNHGNVHFEYDIGQSVTSQEEEGDEPQQQREKRPAKRRKMW